MLFTVAWVLVLAALMVASSYFSYRQNISSDKLWFFATWGIGVIPMWPLVSRFSKNIVADAVVYDTTITIVYYVALLYFTSQFGTVRWWQALGFFMALSGSLLVKIK